MTKSPGTGMNRRQSLKFIAATSVVLGAPAYVRGAFGQETFVFRMAHSEAIGSPLSNAFGRWGEILNERSDGRIDAQHFPASQLGSYSQLIEQSRLGTIEATTGGPDTEEAVAPEIAATGGAPGFIYRDEAHVDAVLQGPIGREVSQIAREKTGVEFVDYGEVGFRHLLSKRPVTKLEELAGLKLRVPELRVWIDFWRALGANPTPLPYAEQYNALSTGIIDGLEADFFSIDGFKWYEQAKYLTLSYHWFLPKAVRVNAAWLDSLPEDLRELIRSSAKEVFADQRAENRANAGAALEKLKGLGVTVYELDAAEKAKWVDATSGLFEEFGQKSPETSAMIAKIRAL
jgi:TRAP-type transport system periplasmic protein